LSHRCPRQRLMRPQPQAAPQNVAPSRLPRQSQLHERSATALTRLRAGSALAGEQAFGFFVREALKFAQQLGEFFILRALWSASNLARESCHRGRIAQAAQGQLNVECTADT